MTLELLFVYGTLRPGFDHPMARYLATRARHLGTGLVRGMLFHLGRYPGVVEAAAEKDQVRGDVFELSRDAEATLRALDDYETLESPTPAYFERQLTDVCMDTGETLRAWIYWYRGDISTTAHRIQSGDWMQVTGD